MKLSDLFTEKDGVSACPVRIVFALGFAAYIALTLYNLSNVKDLDFLKNAKDWISGLADYLGLGGAAVAGKNFTEKSDGN